MKTLERQLADYGARLTELHGPIDSSQVRSGLSVVAVGSGSPHRTRLRWLPGAAAAAVIVIGLSLVLLYTGGSPSGTGATLGEPASVVVGLPPAGAMPSDPTPGELVLYRDGIHGLGMIWIYADGRVISWRPLSVPEGVGEEFSGLTERRLTPEGVEFLRAEVISTGLFASDVTLAVEGGFPSVTIEARSGDRMVRVTGVGSEFAGDAPVATPAQESALRELNALLDIPGAWPADVWEDATLTAHVPSVYSVCFAVVNTVAAEPEDWYWIGAVDPTRVWALLPQPAQNLLGAGEATEDNPERQNGGCTRLATSDARALALILQDAGIERTPSSGVFVPETYLVGFDLPVEAVVSDQGMTGDQVWIQFSPVLPHGEAVWWGPG